ncbi:hypothetical protein HK405_000568 [Cladochytrium tenue]|nr:hypothetical protein HK405_000568 [Cladochytrium tenue]
MRVLILLVLGRATGPLRTCACWRYSSASIVGVTVIFSQFCLVLGGAVGVALAGMVINNVFLSATNNATSPHLHHALAVSPSSDLTTDRSQAVAIRAMLTDATVALQIPDAPVAWRRP